MYDHVTRDILSPQPCPAGLQKSGDRRPNRAQIPQKPPLRTDKPDILGLISGRRPGPAVAIDGSKQRSARIATGPLRTNDKPDILSPSPGFLVLRANEGDTRPPR